MSEFSMSINDESINDKMNVFTNNLRDIEFIKVENSTFNMSILKIKPGEVITIGKIRCKGIVPLDIKFDKTIYFYNEHILSVGIISNINVHNISIECDILDFINEREFKVNLRDIKECFEKYGKTYIRDDDTPKKDPFGKYYISEFDYEKKDFRHYRIPSYDDMIDLKLSNGCSIEHCVIEKSLSNKEVYTQINIFKCPQHKQMFIKGVYGSILDKNPNAYSLKLLYDNYTILNNKEE